MSIFKCLPAAITFIGVFRNLQTHCSLQKHQQLPKDHSSSGATVIPPWMPCLKVVSLIKGTVRNLWRGWKDQNSTIKQYFTAAYGSCWNQWEDWPEFLLTRPHTACHPQHGPCPMSYQGHLTPTPAGSADFSYCCHLPNTERGKTSLFIKKSNWEIF